MIFTRITLVIYLIIRTVLFLSVGNLWSGSLWEKDLGSAYIGFYAGEAGLE